MEAVGAILLVVTFLLSAGFFAFTRKSARRISAVAGVGIFCALPLLLHTQITEVEIPLIGSIRAAARRAESASEALEVLLADARKRVAELERSAEEAEAQLAQLRSNQGFSSLLIQARAGERSAFQKLEAASKEDGPLKSAAASALASVIQDITFGVQMGAKYPWSEVGVNPGEAPIERFRELYRAESYPPMRSAILGEMWKQDRFSKLSKLELVAEAIRTDSNLRVLNSACHLMNHEAKLNWNFVAADEYLKWFEENRHRYE